MSVPLYQAKAELFRTLGHPVRIRVLELLQDGPKPGGPARSVSLGRLIVGQSEERVRYRLSDSRKGDFRRQ